MTIAVTGDVMLGQMMQPFIDIHGYTYPFLNTAPILKNADIALCNLEGPLSCSGAPVGDKKFTFCVSTNAVMGLSFAGFDAVTLANNHILDYGEPAVLETIRILTKNSIQSCGYGCSQETANQPAIIKNNHNKITLLSFCRVPPDHYYAMKNTAGSAFGSLQNIKAGIKKACTKNTTCIVAFHWGTEYTHYPESIQIKLAHAAIDAGADAVIGHGPHVLQGIEIYHGAPILYSLGNFAFGYYYTTFKHLATESMIVLLKANKNSIAEIEIIPLNVNNIATDYRPRIPADNNAQKILSHLQTYSKQFKTTITLSNNRGYIHF